LVRLALVVGLFCLLCGGAVFAYFYNKYQTVVDDRLAKGPLFASVTQVYAAPLEVRVGQHLNVETLASNLRAAGYNANPELGTYVVRGNAILIKPGAKSYHTSDGATVTTEDGLVVSITAENGVALRAFELEPQLITALSNGKARSKRRLVEFKDIPPKMVEAVTAIEDRRFFEHGGVNYGRLIKCGFTDLVSGHKSCGGSTLTQQLAKNIFLSSEKSYKRKMIELLITFQLENRFTKQQLFEMYANEMNLGHQGSFEINGLGEAAETFFGKPLDKLDLAQMATLAGLFQNPSYRNPYRHPERAVERRNLVLDSMVETGAITQAQADTAKAESLRLAPPNLDAAEAPYFVDLVHDQVVQRIGDQNFGNQSLRIYTSLDPELQRVASEAVAAGIKNVDDLVRRRHSATAGPINYPQVSLVALDPHTGQILALVGGRNYSISQLDHALAERPTGSIFKPFVYATAYNTSLVGTKLDDGEVFTALTRLNDDEQDFGNGYTPGNFEHGEYPGMVTAVTAIEHSLNIATIALGQKVGFDNVAALARSAGIVNARGTPSVAIGTYSATPLQMAGAYTVFANSGVHLDPWAVSSVRGVNGDLLADMPRSAKQVLDPRVAYLTQSLLQNVMTYGTAAGVRSRGFTAPAAGKTGTSHDAWFAGYSSNLLCIIWVGNDDYTDISHGLTKPLQGADTAAPIWAEFMSRAIKLPQYSDMHTFSKPDGVTDVLIDKVTNLPADSTCPKGFVSAFLDGTIPAGTCSRMTGGEGALDSIMNGGSKPQSGAQAPPP
jgi:penicillin-binding protein 1B